MSKAFGDLLGGFRCAWALCLPGKFSEEWLHRLKPRDVFNMETCDNFKWYLTFAQLIVRRLMSSVCFQAAATHCNASLRLDKHFAAVFYTLVCCSVRQPCPAQKLQNTLRPKPYISPIWVVVKIMVPFGVP